MANEASATSDAAARKLLGQLEKQSPIFAAYMTEPLREIVISAMALCFVDGVIHGTQEMGGRIDARLADVLKKTA